MFFIRIVLFFYDSRLVSVECYVVVFRSSEEKLEFVAGAMFCGKQGEVCLCELKVCGCRSNC